MKLARREVPKVWGRKALPPPFAHRGGPEPIGEIWFEPPALMPELLVKYLFTGARLSVQVHPDTAQAPPGSRGKDECWFVVAAEAGAQLGIGLRHAVDRATLRAAALDGTIETLMEWHDAAAGDFFYLPAGTVHAIGPGLCLVEIQQNSDITYRLYDYGRPRELHLEQALAVAVREPHPPGLRRRGADAAAQCLVEGPHFAIDLCLGPPEPAVFDRHTGPVLIIPLDAGVVVEGQAVEAGDSAVAPALSRAEFGKAGRTLVASPIT